MTKKKAVKPEDEDELDDLEDELIDDEISEYPELSEKKEKEAVPSSADDNDIEEEEEGFEIEEEARFPDFKHLKLNLTKTVGKNDYELIIEGQSHDFCNILVKHLLKTEGVNAAAYKVTGLVPAQIFIRLDKGKIKDILFEAIESLREEVIEVQKLFQKLT